MGKVSTPDTQTVPVPPYGDYGELWVGQLQPGGYRQGTSMNTVETIGVGKEGIAARASDT